jgi:hypothetical protein
VSVIEKKKVPFFEKVKNLFKKKKKK